MERGKVKNFDHPNSLKQNGDNFYAKSLKLIEESKQKFFERGVSATSGVSSDQGRTAADATSFTRMD